MEFQKPNRPERVIQFGEGVFLRGFADWILQITNETTDFNGSAVVVQPCPRGRCADLERQNCVYTLLMRGLRDGVPVEDRKTIDVISRTVNPFEDYEAYLKLAENPDFRFVISNTTEAGIAYEPGERLADAPHRSFPAKVTALLWRRFSLGLPGFIFLPCELIEQNGAALKRCILQYAADWRLGEAFERFVREENVFCSTLVDRIVTGYSEEAERLLESPDPMLDTCELFHLWVIETDAPILRELPFDRTGLNIIVTDSLERYRTRKVRILNGAHTAMIPRAMLEGLETVLDCMKDEATYRFVRQCVFDEIIPTLDLPLDELTSYAEDVFERFRNPYLKHRCASIALNSISKFRVRVLPSLLAYRTLRGAAPVHLTQSLFDLIRFYQTGTPDDDPELIRLLQNRPTAEILADSRLWGTDLSFLADGGRAV